RCCTGLVRLCQPKKCRVFDWQRPHTSTDHWPALFTQVTTQRPRVGTISLLNLLHVSGFKLRAYSMFWLVEHFSSISHPDIRNIVKAICLQTKFGLGSISIHLVEFGR